MRRAIAVPLLAALLAASPAHAGPEVDAPSEDRLEARVDDAGGAGGAAPSRPRTPRRRAGRGAPATPPVTYVVSPVLDVADGSPCVRVLRRPGDPSTVGAMVDEARLLQLRGRYGRCPVRAAPAPVPASAAEPVVRAWAEQLTLPAPSLVVRPGTAIVGKAAYLEIGGARQAEWRVEAFGWSLDVAATAAYTVDWGDGTVDEGVTSAGGPWPHGDLRHAYLEPGTATITVTAHWTATWTGTGHGESVGGELRGVLRTSAALDVPVVELQAVRLR